MPTGIRGCLMVSVVVSGCLLVSDGDNLYLWLPMGI